MLNRNHLYLIAALCIALTIALGFVLREPTTPATMHIVEPHIPATRAATATPEPRPPSTTVSPVPAQPVTPQPLALATMVVGPSTDPQVLVIVITATPAPQTPHVTPTNPQRQTEGMNTTFNSQTSPLPTPTRSTAILTTPAVNVSPLETPSIPTGAPDPDTEQAVYDLLDALIAAETAYYNVHGRYAQLLVSDSAQCPEGETCITLDYPAGLLAGVDVYQSPGGAGYEVHIHVDGWRLVVAAGPEVWRAEAWHYEP